MCDDHDVQAYIAIRVLTQMGFEVVAWAKDGKEAVELAKLHQPDLMSIDVIMPLRTGDVAADMISELPKPPVILLATNLGQDAIVARAKAKGWGVVVKPYDPSLFKRRVETVWPPYSASATSTSEQ